MQDRASDLDILFRQIEREAQHDSSDALERLLERVGPSLLHFFANQGFHGPDGEDLVQETLFRVYRGIGGFRQAASLKTWLFKIARNLSHNAHRDLNAQKRKGHEIAVEEAFPIGDDDAAEYYEPSEQATDALTDVLEREKKQQMARILESMAPQMRRCLYLYYYQELSIQAIAKVMKLAPTTVKSHLQDGRKRLRSLIGDDFP